jgi:DNA polymerase III gamma/tau subunit
MTQTLLNALKRSISPYLRSRNGKTSTARIPKAVNCLSNNGEVPIPGTCRAITEDRAMMIEIDAASNGIDDIRTSGKGQLCPAALRKVYIIDESTC